MQYQNPKPCYRLSEFYALQVSKVTRVLFLNFVLTLPLQKKAKFMLPFAKQYFPLEGRPLNRPIRKTTFSKPISQGIYVEFAEQGPRGNVQL